MKKETRIHERLFVGVVLLLLSHGFMVASAAPVIRTQASSFKSGITRAWETPGAFDAFRGPDPSTMVCAAVVWALFLRRRSH